MAKLYDLFNNKASLYAANRPSYSPNVLKYLQNAIDDMLRKTAYTTISKIKKV